MAHSLAGIYSPDYVNRFPGEVSALVTIDGTVPEDFAVAPKTGGWARLLSMTGWVRWMTALHPAIIRALSPGRYLPRAGHRTDPIDDDPELFEPSADR